MPQKVSGLSGYWVLVGASQSLLESIQQTIEFDKQSGEATKGKGSRESAELKHLELVPLPQLIDEIHLLAEANGSLVCSRQNWSTGYKWVIEFICDQRNIGSISAARAEVEPFGWPVTIMLSARVSGHLWLFGKHLWKLSKGEWLMDREQKRLVFLNTIDRERRKFEQLKRRFSGLGGNPIESRRAAIPDEVRIFVWRRDEGRCVKCGSQERLEFDHIIPVSKGGSNTERNIQLLCEQCNLQKSDNI